MEFKTRITTIEDLDRLCEIEVSAMPESPPYLRDNADYFYNKAPGEIYGVENEDNLLIGMGRYSRLPDGSGWLETLRVHKDFQRKGAGKLVYEEYFKKAKLENTNIIRMYTESYNIASKTLAESLDFTLAGTYGNMEISLDEKFENVNSFNLVKSIDELNLEKMIESWGKFISLNRTFFELNSKNIQWMISEEMVYKNEENLVILGARMLKKRGLFLAYVAGDLEESIKFAINKAIELNSKKLTSIFPVDYLEYKNVLIDLGFKDIYDLFTMEKNI